MAKYPVADEAIASLEDLEAMKNDPSLIVVLAMAVPWSDGQQYSVLYWKNERGVLPPWVKITA